MVVYGIYNSDSLEQLIDTVHKMHIKTTWDEKLIASKLNFGIILFIQGWSWPLCHNFSSVFNNKRKYVRMYERFINQL